MAPLTGVSGADSVQSGGSGQRPAVTRKPVNKNRLQFNFGNGTVSHVPVYNGGPLLHPAASATQNAGTGV